MTPNDPATLSRRLASLQEIAADVGVSPMTVSRALRGVGRVRDETRQRVLEAAQRRGYNWQSSLLLTGARVGGGSDHRLRVLLPVFRPGDTHVTGHFGSRLVTGLRDRLQEEDGELQILDVQDVDDLFAQWPRSRVHGIVLRTVLPSAWLARLRERAAIVSAISHDVHPGIDCIYFNEFKGSVMVLDHLYRQGHRHIAWASTERSNPAANVARHHYDEGNAADRQAFQFTRARLGAWQTLDQGLGLDDCRHEFIQVRTYVTESGTFDHERIGRDIARAFLLLRQRPTALVVSSDELAIAARQELAQEGLEVPRDLSLMAYLVSQLGATTNSPLTGLRLPFEAAGRMVPELIQRRRARPDHPAVTVMLDPALIEGGTVGPPPPATPGPA